MIERSDIFVGLQTFVLLLYFYYDSSNLFPKRFFCASVATFDQIVSNLDEVSIVGKLSRLFHVYNNARKVMLVYHPMYDESRTIAIGKTSIGMCSRWVMDLHDE